MICHRKYGNHTIATLMALEPISELIYDPRLGAAHTKEVAEKAVEITQTVWEDCACIGSRCAMWRDNRDPQDAPSLPIGHCADNPHGHDWPDPATPDEKATT